MPSEPMPAADVPAATVSETLPAPDATHALLELAHDLARADGIDEVASVLARATPAILAADRAAVYLWDERTQTLTARAAHGYPEEALGPLLSLVFQPSDTPLFQEVFVRLEPSFYDADDVADDFVASHMKVFGAAQALVMPLVAHGERLGLISATRLDRRTEAPFDDDLRERMCTLADQAATALQNVSLLEQHRTSMENLREAHKLKSEFLAMVSHELRTPVAAIMGMAKTLSLRADQIDEATRARFLRAIVERGEQLERLVEDLLQSSREVELTFAPIDLAQLAQAAAAEAERLAPGRGIVCRTPGRVPVMADGGRLRQILDNLIDNAIKYAPGTPVTILTGRDGDEAWLSVADQGPGMAPEDVASAFDAFYQADSSDSRGAGGVGLGLYITKRIVDAHSGRIEIDSEPGRGTTVTVRIPAGGPDPRRA